MYLVKSFADIEYIFEKSYLSFLSIFYEKKNTIAFVFSYINMIPDNNIDYICAKLKRVSSSINVQVLCLYGCLSVFLAPPSFLPSIHVFVTFFVKQYH